MKGALLPITFCMLLVFNFNQGYGQTDPCTANTPRFTIDLSGQPNGSFSINPLQRDGLCCDAVSPDKCIMATITLDSNASGIKFSISSGAVPPGALYYQIDCEDPTPVGQQICLDGVGPHILTFCKPGNNQNGYLIESMPRSIVPDSVDVTVGCSVEIGTLGYFVDTTLEWHDLTSSDGRYLDYLNCTDGCDTVIVTPDYDAPAYVDYEVCGNLIDTICQDTSSYLCRQVRVYINKIVVEDTAEICQTQSYTLPDGSLGDTTGLYVSTLEAAGGCDSIILTHLTVNPRPEVYNTMVSCDSAIVFGTWYLSSQMAIDTFETVAGCDSIIYTNIIIHPSKYTYLSAVSCDSALVNGNWYYTTQTVVDSFKTMFNCDSLVYTDLTINPSKIVSLLNTSCDSAQINGNWYYSSQTVIDSFQTVFGCDSVVYTELTINPSKETFLAETSCDSALINNNWYYSSQLVTDSFKTYLNCDSVVYSELTINPSKETFLAETYCDSGLVNGNWYYSSQTVTDSFLTSLNCDSIVFTNLTINNSKETYLSSAACDSAFVNGNWYFITQLVVDSFVTSRGCDSVVFTDLRIDPSKVRNNTLVSCDSANVHGEWYHNSQMILDSFSTYRGCDSLVYTDLTVNYTKITNIEIVSCIDAWVEGRRISSSQVLAKVLQSSASCDSIVYTNVVIYKPSYTSEKVVGCDSIYVKGNPYYASTTRIDTLVNIVGCDSIHTTDIEVNYSSLRYENKVICEGQLYRLPDGKYTSQTGLYTSNLLTEKGCDSVINTALQVNITGYEPQPDIDKCLGDEITLYAGNGIDIVDYEWSTGENSEMITTKALGTYYLTVRAQNGCEAKDTIRVGDAECPACPLFTPTAFTPNNSGLNDEFKPVFECDLIEYRFEIYNRWGEQLFQTFDENQYWDASFMGELVQQDVYVWLLYYKDKRSLLPIYQSGTVTVIRE